MYSVIKNVKVLVGIRFHSSIMSIKSDNVQNQ